MDWRIGQNVPWAVAWTGEQAFALRPSEAFAGMTKGRIIYRTDVTPGMEALAKTFPAGLEVVFSCYCLFGADFSRQVERLRQEWDHATRTRRAAGSGLAV